MFLFSIYLSCSPIKMFCWVFFLYFSFQHIATKRHNTQFLFQSKCLTYDVCVCLFEFYQSCGTSNRYKFLLMIMLLHFLKMFMFEPCRELQKISKHKGCQYKTYLRGWKLELEHKAKMPDPVPTSRSPDLSILRTLMPFIDRVLSYFIIKKTSVKCIISFKKECIKKVILNLMHKIMDGWIS